MRRFSLPVAVVVALAVCPPAAAQDKGLTLGVGFSVGEAAPDTGVDYDLESFTLFGRWQHQDKGWGVMTEIRDGEDDEDLPVALEYRQVNLYATYTWLRKGVARPFVKAGISNTDVEIGFASDDATELIVGAGIEVGRGRWAFYASIDATEPEIGTVDTEVNHVTLGAVVRF